MKIELYILFLSYIIFSFLFPIILSKKLEKFEKKFHVILIFLIILIYYFVLVFSLSGFDYT